MKSLQVATFFLPGNLTRCTLPLSCLALVACLAGCGGPTGHPCSVSGTVTLNNEPIEDGTVVFEPQGQGGARGGATITDGSYEIPVDSGMWAGPFIVRIQGFRETGKTQERFETLEGESDEPVTELEQIVPPKYNTESSLRVELEPGDNNKDFELAAGSE